MPRRPGGPLESDDAGAIEALEALNAEQMRSLIRALMPWFDDRLYARFLNAAIDAAARSSLGWLPSPPGERLVNEIERFAAASRRDGYADPADVDACLRAGSNAFLARDYAAAYLIFDALLVPLAHAAFDLGQHETVDEVLGMEVGDCAAQYAVSTYMTTAAPHRPQAVLDAVDAMAGLWHFSAPLRELEQVAVEPLPGFDDFLVQWREAVAGRAGSGDWPTSEDRWLHEVVVRIEGPKGLGELARATRKVHDLRAWCDALVSAGDWATVLEANQVAVECLADRPAACADFLDGAALAVQQLRGEDLAKWLERAWRASPSLARLQRWLGASETRHQLRERVVEALASCPARLNRQRALLHLLVGEPAAAARLLAEAPGLGWSSPEHPGPLLFPLFTAWLGRGARLDALFEADDPMKASTWAEEPWLVTPALGDVIILSGAMSEIDPIIRETLIAAMRRAAELRIAGVTGNKRRRHYAHAAGLAVACVRADGSLEATTWLEALMQSYRRYPALQREFGSLGRGRCGETQADR